MNYTTPPNMDEAPSVDIDNGNELKKLMNSTNLADGLDEQQLIDIGMQCKEGFERDLNSRKDWENELEEWTDLAMQTREPKTFPWSKASNVKYPLLSTAAMQFAARAYPSLVPSNGKVVTGKVIGKDPTGEKKAKSDRVATYMSYQLMYKMRGWEEDMDKLLMMLPIIGTVFKKTWYDSASEDIKSCLIGPKNLVVDYWATSLQDAERVSEIIEMTPRVLKERQNKEIFLDVDLGQQTTPEDIKHARFDGAIDFTVPYTLIEQHTYYDLDDDGYDEPYIITFHRESGTVLRIVPRFQEDDIEMNDKGDVTQIHAQQYYTKFSFVPNPDGSFYSLGFGMLLGPINEAVNTLINQLIDAGTMANTAGGFLSRGIKLRGGNYSFAPLEWKHVESTGDDLRKGIMPLPVREPSQVLFTLLSLLINYGERIGGAVDIMVGENPGQNTPAETSRTMAEQGMKIFSGIFKRTYRSLKQEFRKQYRLNQLYFDTPVSFGDVTITLEDYSGNSKNILPAADPHMISDSQRVNQAGMLSQLAANSPGYDMYQVQKRVLEAWRVTDIEQVLPDPKGPNAIKQAPHYKAQDTKYGI